MAIQWSMKLNKDPDDYQSYTPQCKIGKSLNKESGDLIKYYKTGQQEDGGYKGLRNTGRWERSMLLTRCPTFSIFFLGLDVGNTSVVNGI